MWREWRNIFLMKNLPAPIYQKHMQKHCQDDEYKVSLPNPAYLIIEQAREWAGVSALQECSAVRHQATMNGFKLGTWLKLSGESYE